MLCNTSKWFLKHHAITIFFFCVQRMIAALSRPDPTIHGLRTVPMSSTVKSIQGTALVWFPNETLGALWTLQVWSACTVSLACSLQADITARPLHTHSDKMDRHGCRGRREEVVQGQQWGDQWSLGWGREPASRDRCTRSCTLVEGPLCRELGSSQPSSKFSFLLHFSCQNSSLNLVLRRI